jgi:two-component system phosphate regulon response regulator OmpR
MPEPVKDYQSLPHILVVDDDDRIRKLVSRYLNEHGFLSFTAADAEEAKTLLEAAKFDAMVLDVMMPGQDGRSLTQELRQTTDLPVLLLTALGETDDRVAGFQSGADDYLSKPFDARELVLRLQAILRRRPKHQAAEAGPVKIGVWSYQPGDKELTNGAERVILTDVEETLLKALVSRAGEILSRDDLAAMCDMDAGERTIDVQVTRLRKKLGEDSKSPRYLQTVRGKGYLLRVEKA